MGKLVKRSEKEVCKWAFQIVTEFEDICAPVNSHQKTTSAVEGNKMDRIIYSDDICQLIFLAILFIVSPSTHDKMVVLTEMKVLPGLSSTDFHSSKLIYLQPQLCVPYDNSRNQFLPPDVAPVPRKSATHVVSD